MSYFCCLFGSNDDQGNVDEWGNESGVDTISEEKECLEKINLLQDEGEDYQRDMWRLVIAEKSALLTRARTRFAARQSNTSQERKTEVNGRTVHTGLDDTSPDTFLQTLTTTYTNNGYVKRMPRVRQIFEGLRPFVAAVNTLVQTDTVAALVWGSVCLVFESVLRFAKFWEDLRGMFDDLTRALPRFHGYIQVLHTPRLHAAMRSVYASFIDVCMMTLDCLHSNQCFVLLRVQWTGFLHEFRKAIGEVRTANSEFEKEAQLAHVQEEAQRHAEVIAILQRPAASTQVQFKSNITMGRNDKFTGRDDTLALLHSYLEPNLDGDVDKRPFRTCLIHAIGGMGKTETALEYTYRFGEYYWYKFWLKAQTKTSLQESFLEVVDELGIVKDPDMHPSRKKELGLEWFRKTEHPWLLVYDNAEDLATVREFWPAGNKGAAIVTSQNPAFGRTTTHSIPLHPLPRAEGRALIQVYLARGGSEQESAEHLSASLGGLPLAIVHFTGYIARSQCPIDHISRVLDQRLRTSTIWKMNRDTPADIGAYQYTLDTVWDLALQRLTGDARLLLDFIAFLDPDDIPVDLFIGDGSTSERSGATDGQWEYWDVYRFNEAIAILCERHLVTRIVQENSDSLRTHRALQMCILQRLDDDQPRRAERFDTVVAILRRAVPIVNVVDRSDSSQFSRFAKYLLQVASVQRVFKNSEPPITGTLSFASVLDDTCYYAYTNYNNTVALTFAETGEAICSAHAASDPTAKRMLPGLLTIIAMITHYRGTAGRAHALATMRRVVALREEELSAIPRADWTDIQCVNYARAHADLAWELCESNQPGDAAPLYTQCIGIYTAMAHALRLALVRVNELMVLSTSQRVPETRAQAGEALATVGKLLGADNPVGNLARFQVALAYFTIGDAETARGLVQTVFEQRLMTLGHGHDLTLASQYILAVCAQNCGRLDLAEEHLREVLAHGEAVTEDWREEDVMRLKFRLTVVLRAKGGGEEEKEEEEGMRREVGRYLADKRPAETGKEFTDADDMALLDVGVTLDHGRTAGIWSNGKIW